MRSGRATLILAGLLVLLLGCSPYSMAALGAIIASSGGDGGDGKTPGPQPPPPGTLDVAEGLSAGTTACPSGTDVEILQISLTAGTVGINVESIQFDASGTGDDASGVAQVCLWRDVNTDGLLDAGDIPIGTCQTFGADDDSVIFTGLAETVLASTQVYWLLTYDLTASPTAGQTFCADVAPGNVVANDGTQGITPGYTPPLPIQGCLTMDAGSLAVAAGPAPPPTRSVTSCGTNESVLQIQLTAGACEAALVDSITFTASGTGDDLADVTGASLYVDNNQDGLWDGGDGILSGPATYTADNGTITFGSLSQSIPVGTSVTWILVYDLSGSAGLGDTFAARLAADVDVSASGGTTLQPLTVSGAPIVGNAVTTDVSTLSAAAFTDVNDNDVLDPGDIVTVTFTAPVNIGGNPLADTVFALDPPTNTFGNATADPGALSNEIEIIVDAATVIQPNGTIGVHFGSTGINMDPAQTDVTFCGQPVQPLGTFLDLGGELNPRITSVLFVDQNQNCLADQGDTIDVTFTTNITVQNTDPIQAFQLPVSGDRFQDAGAGSFQGPINDVPTVSILIGANPILTPGGVFDPAVTVPGSPSGIDVTPNPLQIVDAAFPTVTAEPLNPPGVDLQLQPASLWESIGDDADLARYGSSVALAGNVNGDAFMDVIIGAPQENGGTGKVFVYLGSATGLSTAGADWTADGLAAGDRFGYSVACAGDVNNDTFDDILVGAPGGNAGVGGAYVWHGGQPTLSGLGDPLLPDWSSPGTLPQANAELGHCVASAGDVNNDSYDDVIIGAHWYGQGGSRDIGLAEVHFGGPNGVDDPASPLPWTSSGESFRDGEFGFSVAGGGDVDNDGFDDVVIGAPLADAPATEFGKAYLYLGDGATPLGSSPWTSTGEAQVGAHFGWSVAFTGDVNADGFDDLAVGAPDFDTPNVNAGKVYLFLGNGSGLSATEDWTSVGDDITNARYGASVGGAGDVNLDTYDDLIIGSPDLDTPTPSIAAGKVFLYPGNGVTLAAGPFWTSIGENQAGAGFGFSVSSGAGITGPGADKILVGAYLFDSATFAEAGKVYIFCLGP